MDDAAAIARVFSRYLDAHFSTILAVGLLRQLNAEQYLYYFALYFASFVVIVLRLTPISLPLSLSLSRILLKQTYTRTYFVNIETLIK